MKKFTLTMLIVLGLGFTALAQGNGGFFEKGPGRGEDYYNRETTGGLIHLPGEHGSEDDSDGAPLGTGITVLAGLGAAYLVAKRRKE